MYVAEEKRPESNLLLLLQQLHRASGIQVESGNAAGKMRPSQRLLVLTAWLAELEFIPHLIDNAMLVGYELTVCFTSNHHAKLRNAH